MIYQCCLWMPNKKKRDFFLEVFDPCVCVCRAWLCSPASALAIRFLILCSSSLAASSPWPQHGNLHRVRGEQRAESTQMSKSSELWALISAFFYILILLHIQAVRLSLAIIAFQLNASWAFNGKRAADYHQLIIAASGCPSQHAITLSHALAGYLRPTIYVAIYLSVFLLLQLKPVQVQV